MRSTHFEHPRVGVAAIIRREFGNETKILLGKRKGSHGAGMYSCPGGSQEMWETPFQTAERESLEETGMIARAVRKGPWLDDQFPEDGKHFANLIVILDWVSGEPQIMEADKCEGWGWYRWDALPRPLFQAIEELQRSGFDPLTIEP